MGKVFSVIQRKVNRFNIESRAQKIISKEKQTPAPKHQSTLKEFEKIKQELSELPKAELEKDVALDTKLKEVYVVSTDGHVEKPGSESLRPLPQERRAVEAPEFGFLEPSIVPRGRCTLQQALRFISDHQEDPVRWRHDVIAQEYKLQLETVEKILLHYRMFQVYIPKDKNEKKESMFVLPRINKKQLAADPEVKLKRPESSIEDK
ncbi:protein NDUFAF4 homolog [Bacillus rossius redtenbacheri]|uniref:protein NDUFAF4 homolog n=1 Tax=Bacillus rossius redtenbacheri TaxID=93214 RepID=UPI002FDD2327